ADHVPDYWDEMPTVSGQWEDSDGDGFGDNTDGPYSDDCPSSVGTSFYVTFGCHDYDGDGFSNIVDDCDSDKGNSHFDRQGCDDIDRDGWSDNDGTWYSGDQYVENWKQSIDSDGDTRGDNHGTDCCDVYHPSTGQSYSHTPDWFPHNKHQWEDIDEDGYGDNSSHLPSGDQCLSLYGTSRYDRLGCVDSDGDGWSDPTGEGTNQEWNASRGADMWPDDPTQWNDTDGDGFGDNSSDNATNPDKFPLNPAAANDSDNDGYPDIWTDLYDGNNSEGLYIDDCPGAWGDSWQDRKGCMDSDGDGWSDLGDEFPLEPTQWTDSDEDGFGDNPIGILGDQCLTLPGVLNGTLGVGCPIINTDDADLDGILDDNDACPFTP
ncbi:MAG: hypothetical protein NZ802_09170, partial [Candidatus Poseidoniales archaeon]|nr:hypothetical protein [Candidatus Poseidoniales archaeon]